MCKLRDVVIFLAGAEFFHTLSHLLLPYLIEFPFTMRGFVVTSKLNILVIVVNAIITILLLWWAHKLSKK